MHVQSNSVFFLGGGEWRGGRERREEKTMDDKRKREPGKDGEAELKNTENREDEQMRKLQQKARKRRKHKSLF